MPTSEGPLLTAVIVRKPQGWMIWWSDIGFFRPDGARTLDWLAQATDSLIEESGGAFRTLDALVEATDALVRDRDPGRGGCLQYKIYPWGMPGVGDERSPFEVFMIGSPQSGSGQLVTPTWPHTAFQILGDPGYLQVSEIATGETLELHGHSPDDLVNRLGAVRGEGPHTFTWIRDIASLHPD